jgi:hypothetical protein
MGKTLHHNLLRISAGFLERIPTHEKSLSQILFCYDNNPECMRQRVLSAFFLVCLLMASACVNVNVSAPVTPNTTVTLPATMIADTSAPTTVTTDIPTIAATIPAGCQAIISAADQDKEYIDTLKKYAIVTGAYSLVGSCNVGKASGLNQIISNHTKPKTALLQSGRASLISAISQCIGPRTSATTSRIKDDLKTYEDMMEDYEEAIKPCKKYLSADQKQSLVGVDESIETDDGWLFTGTDGDMLSFQVENSGMYIISYKCSGTSKIFVTIKNEYDNQIKTIESAEGQKTGKDTLLLAPGKYYLKTDTVGDWSVTVKPE